MRLLKLLVIGACLASLQGCGGGSGSDSPPPPPVNWDEIIWDQHDWS